MSRQDELSGVVNPVKQYVNWSSTEKKFSFYRKETGEKGFLSLPLEITFLKTSSTVKGWSDANNCGIYSNQVISTQNEILTVKAGDVKIASGLYRDIKDTVKAAGGKYHLNVYCLINGEVSVLQLKGSVLMEWMEFFKGHKKSLDSNTILVKEYNEGKKGAVKYTTPKFEKGSPIADIQFADDSYDEVKKYLGYKPEEATHEEEEWVDVPSEADDDLPF